MDNEVQQTAQNNTVDYWALLSEQEKERIRQELKALLDVKLHHPDHQWLPDWNHHGRDL